MSKDIAQNPTRISFNPKGVDVAALDEVADQRDVSRAELIREQLREVVAQHAEADGGSADLHRPAHEELAEAYDRLLALSDHPTGTRRVSVDEAKDKLHHSECPKEAVKSRLLKPLADQGFISVRTGKIRVHRRTESAVERAEAEADAAFDRLTAAAELPSQHDLTEEQKRLRKFQRADLDVPFGLTAWVATETLWRDETAPEVEA
ncbi:CopG family transcriptional regulator [Halorarius halobius]|uniref:ribbon-helix-helix domain-containing protein n=1 Tax=Halorarius halobius TaxID=2962671 RepID=UPI0020CDEA50|nr:CopG family transcriptional regulator [Halorarius halobius]